MFKTNKNIIFFIFCFVLLNSCVKKNLKEITTEPSIERIIDTIEKTRNFSYLAKYIQKNPAKIEYIEDKDINCILYDFKNQKIMIPRNYKNSEIFLTLQVLKAIYIWKIHNEYKLDELLVEEEILGTLNQIYYIMESNYPYDLLGKDKFFNNNLKKEFCLYITMNTQITTHYITNKNSIINNKCELPLESIISQRAWFSSIKEAMQNDNFFDLMYQRVMLKVKRGKLTYAESIKNDATLRSKPIYEVYRDQRSFYDISMEKIDKFETYYKNEINKDTQWRLKHKDDIENAKYELNSCME